MKYYLADILTLTRLILSVILLGLAFLGGDSAVAFFIFILGELTDAFDGTCATKWPFPRGKVPRYRKYAAKYDMLADILLAVGMIAYFTARVSLPAGLIIIACYGIFALIVEFVVYGKLLGHPDDYRKGSLMERNFPRAKRLILIRRNIYLFFIALVSAWTFYASTLPLVVKIVVTVVAVLVSLFLWFFLSQRRHNISRDAVDAERKLSRTSSKKR